MVAAGRARATNAAQPLIDDPFAEPLVRAVGIDFRSTSAEGLLPFLPADAQDQRIAQNFALFDFELTHADVEAISALDRGEPGRIGPNPDTFDLIPD
ncbi:MAG: 2,5-diketo-D-gluconate reductase [Mycobacterium sp.]|jgi:2,5-diketo-D-gluconate reductase A|nr:2,5-diketo-D-gluconate reductase [Mycobacterium sp.]